jgi:hypothetical protein
MGGRFLSRRDSPIVAMHEVRAPKGLEDSAQGFNPGNRRPPEGAADRTY